MIKCVAIDDEPIALDIIREYCNRSGGIELDCFTSPIEGMEHIETVRPDIVFLDIEMNSHNGVTLARKLPKGTCLIFTTAYSQYAIDGFNADAVDFLHKPIFYRRFQRAMEKAVIFLSKSVTAETPREAITLKVEHKNVILDLKDILYIEAMDNYVKVYRCNMPMVMSQITMKEMETLLPANRFIRVHRSYIISLNAVDRFSNKKIYIRKCDRPIPVGRKYIGSFNYMYDIFKNK